MEDTIIPLISEGILKEVVSAKSAVLREDKDPRALTLLKRRAFFSGDHVGKNLELWNGLKPTDPQDYEEFKRRIVVLNITTPILNRFTWHILARDPEWVASVDATPLEPKNPRVVSLAGWHKGDGRVHRELKRADRAMRWGGRSYLWMYVPDVLREILGQEDPQRPGIKIINRDATDLDDALRRIRLEALDATQAGVIERDGLKVAYWRSYSITTPDGRSQNRLEVYTRQHIGVYVDEGDKPKLATDVGENPRPNPLYDPTDPLTFRCLMHELERDEGPQIDPLLDAQNSVSVAGSNVRRNNDLGGWQQYYTTNAAVPRDETTGEKTNYRFGPSRVLDIQADYLKNNQGEPLIDRNGEPIVLPVDVGTFAPVNSQPMRDDADWFERKALSMMNQLWTVEGEGQVSGEAKKQSRMSFDVSLPGEAEPAAAALAWVIETVDRFAQWVQGQDTVADPLTVDARLFLNVAKVDLETLKHLDAMQTAGKISLEALLESTPGIDDVATELKRIKAERAENVALLNEIRELGFPEADWLTALQKAGVAVSPESIQRAQDMADAGLEALSTAESEGEDGATNVDGQD